MNSEFRPEGGTIGWAQLLGYWKSVSFFILSNTHKGAGTCTVLKDIPLLLPDNIDAEVDLLFAPKEDCVEIGKTSACLLTWWLLWIP